MSYGIETIVFWEDDIAVLVGSHYMKSEDWWRPLPLQYGSENSTVTTFESIVCMGRAPCLHSEAVARLNEYETKKKLAQMKREH